MPVGTFAHILGLDNAGSYWYLFWSGIGSDITEFAVLGLIWHRLNCHSKGCPRIGIHRVIGTPYVTCRKHHPRIQDKVTAEEIAQESI